MKKIEVYIKHKQSIAIALEMIGFYAQYVEGYIESGKTKFNHYTSQLTIEDWKAVKEHNPGFKSLSNIANINMIKILKPQGITDEIRTLVDEVREYEKWQDNLNKS